MNNHSTNDATWYRCPPLGDDDDPQFCNICGDEVNAGEIIQDDDTIGVMHERCFEVNEETL